MKSGAVNTNKRYKYFEPESWRFGESPYRGGATNYMRHASGQIYGLSAPLARCEAAHWLSLYFGMLCMQVGQEHRSS